MSDNEIKKNGSSEPNGFIKEEYVPPKRHAKARRRLQIVVTVLGLAILFGVIARASYWVSDRFLNTLMDNSNKEDVNLRPDPTEGTKPGESGNSEYAEINTELLGQYDKLFSGIQEAASALAGCTCTVYACQTMEDPIFEAQEEITSGFGGIIIADNKVEYMVLTSYSTLKEKKADHYRIGFDNGTVAAAEIAGFDEELDLVVLSVIYSEIPEEDRKGIKVVRFGDSSTLRPGSLVIAVGAPNGVVGSVDFGMVNSVGETAYVVDGAVTVLRTNMMSLPNAEGILVNASGEMVGILSHAFAGEGQNLSAIATADVQNVLNALINNRERVYFGAVFSDIDNGTKNELKLENGIMITDVLENSSAFDAEFRKGDIILSVGGNTIHFVSQFQTLLQSMVPGQQIEIEFLRNGKHMTERIVTKSK